MSVRVESIIKITKNASAFHSQGKNRVFASWFSHVHKRKVTLLSEDMLHRVYSMFDTLFPSHIMNS